LLIGAIVLELSFIPKAGSTLVNSRTAGVMGKALIPPDLEMYMLVSGGIEVDPKSKTNLMRV
jgi:hypothetical protein